VNETQIYVYQHIDFTFHIVDRYLNQHYTTSCSRYNLIQFPPHTTVCSGVLDLKFWITKIIINLVNLKAFIFKKFHSQDMFHEFILIIGYRMLEDSVSVQFLFF
jgi:hypothetical protein